MHWSGLFETILSHPQITGRLENIILYSKNGQNSTTVIQQWPQKSSPGTNRKVDQFEFPITENPAGQIILSASGPVNPDILRLVCLEWIGQQLRDELQHTENRFRRVMEEISTIHDINRMLSSGQEMEPFLKRILEHACHLLGAESGSVMLLTEDKTELEFRVVLGPKATEVSPYRLALGKGISGWVAANNKPILIPHAYQDERFDPSFDQRSGYRTESILCVPLAHNEQVLGVITILNRLDRQAFTEYDQQMIMTFAAQAAMALENSRLVREVLEKERIDQELKIAAEIQQRILPQSIPGHPLWEISTTYVPCKVVSGDYFNVYQRSENQTVLVIADVSGKGVPGAMLVSNMEAALVAFLRSNQSFADIAAALNDHIRLRSAADQYITFFIAEYNHLTHQLYFVNAGHNCPLLVHEDGSYQELSTGDIFIGFVPWVYHEGQVDIAATDLLLLYTDGLIEAMNAEEEEFGVDRVIDILRESRNKPIAGIRQTILDKVNQFADMTSFEDDLTMILFKRKQEEGL